MFFFSSKNRELADFLVPGGGGVRRPPAMSAGDVTPFGRHSRVLSQVPSHSQPLANRRQHTFPWYLNGHKTYTSQLFIRLLRTPAASQKFQHTHTPHTPYTCAWVSYITHSSFILYQQQHSVLLEYSHNLCSNKEVSWKKVLAHAAPTFTIVYHNLP